MGNTLKKMDMTNVNDLNDPRLGQYQNISRQIRDLEALLPQDHRADGFTATQSEFRSGAKAKNCRSHFKAGRRRLGKEINKLNMGGNRKFKQACGNRRLVEGQVGAALAGSRTLEIEIQNLERAKDGQEKRLKSSLAGNDFLPNRAVYDEISRLAQAIAAKRQQYNARTGKDYRPHKYKKKRS